MKKLDLAMAESGSSFEKLGSPRFTRLSSTVRPPSSSQGRVMGTGLSPVAEAECFEGELKEVNGVAPPFQETFVRLRDEALASEGGESSSEITRKVWLEATGGPKRGGKIYPFGNQGGALGLVPKGSSGVPSSFMHSQMPKSFESMVLQLEEANTMNNWLKEQLTASAQHEQRMHEYYTSVISTVFTELGMAMTLAPTPRSIPEPPSFSTHVHHRDPLNAPSTSQSNAHDDDDASLEESQED
ncbi:hypothetical protein Dimus_023160 [Dionaea muscipula]